MLRLRPFIPVLALLVLAPIPASARFGAEPFTELGAGRSVAAVETYFIPARDGALLAARADEAERTAGTPHQFADPVPMAVTPETRGTWETLADGARLWRLRIDAPGATDLNLGFDRFLLPPGATLYAIAEGRAYWEGPYTYEDNESHGQLWLPVIPGDRAIVELYVPRDAKFEPDLSLAQVGYGFRDWFRLAAPLRSGSCNNDVICPEGDPWRDDIASVAVYQLSGSWTCSGQMVNNTAADFTPYFLTANHCGISSGNAATMVVYWNFESPVCGMLGGGSLADNQTGAFFRASYSTSDFCLVELDEDPDPDFGVYFAGWDNTNTAATSITGIHHPSTDEKAISFDNAAPTVTSYLGTTSPGDGTHWRIGVWDDGTTEPGSSGSGIWNQNHRLVGQLHGGYASCTVLDSDWYGRLSVSWNGGGSAANQLKAWLDPGNTGATVLDGSFPSPFIRFASFGGTDLCAGGYGDGNAIWEPGETVRIPVTLTAAGAPFTNVSGTLTCSTPGVTVLDGAATWPNIPQNGSATSDAPHFTVVIDPAVACGAVLDFDVSVTATEGGPFLYSFQHDVGQSLEPAGLPAGIPDANATGVTSTLAVGDNVTLTDVNVRVQISHTYVGDLMIRLRSPNGTIYTLLDRPGVPASTYGCSNDNMDVTFDSASGVNLESYCAGSNPWYTGVAAPVTSLNGLNGQSSQGNWDLIVSDHAGSDTGSIVSWELLTTPAISGVCEVCEGGVGAPVVAAPAGFGLAPVRPNPFGASAQVVFSLDRPGPVTLDVIDVAGRRVVTLTDRDLPAGAHAFPWDGRDTAGRNVAAGIYFVRLVSGDRTDLERVVRIR